MKTQHQTRQESYKGKVVVGLDEVSHRHYSD